jgi:serine/threonine protein kinase
MCVHNAAGTVTAVAKRLIRRLREDPVARAQLDVEVRVLRALEGRGAPRLLDAGEDGEGPWLVMERLAMPTLAARIREPHGDHDAFVSRVALGALHALRQVHDAADVTGPLGIVHGDVSPENLLVHDGDDARVIDFGLATFRDAPAPTLGAFRGTVRYVAPEVARGEPATVLSDLFSLGLTLLHAASNEAPRPGEHLASLLVQAGEAPVADYAARASTGLDAALRDALLAMVAFDPRSRPRSAREARLVVEGAHGSR